MVKFYENPIFFSLRTIKPTCVPFTFNKQDSCVWACPNILGTNRCHTCPIDTDLVLQICEAAFNKLMNSKGDTHQ